MQVAWGSQAAVPRTHSLMGMSQRGPSMPAGGGGGVGGVKLGAARKAEEWEGGTLAHHPTERAPVPAVPLTQVCWQLGAGGSKAPRADGVHPATGCWLSWATVCALSAMGLNASSEG
jgi:hypothetical protein